MTKTSPGGDREASPVLFGTSGIWRVINWLYSPLHLLLIDLLDPSLAQDMPKGLEECFCVMQMFIHNHD